MKTGITNQCTFKMPYFVQNLYHYEKLLTGAIFPLDIYKVYE